MFGDVPEAALLPQAAASAGLKEIQQATEAVGMARFTSGELPGSSGGGVRVRTAAEIRAAYGRPALSSEHQRGAAAADLSGVMADTKAALAERGEKLQQLQDKGADLEESAAAFAAMAKQLAAKEKPGRWFGV